MSESPSPLCEICNYDKHHRGYSMIRCTECDIWVHQECYFDSVKVENFEKSGKFVCFACQAVGKTVEAVETHLSSDYKKIKQSSRPMKCELCSVSDQVTAMHPLYDYHGQGGRQVFRKFKKKDGSGCGYRLAWGHSICCYFLSRDGFMYGFDNEGEYHGESPEEEARVDDTRKPNRTSIISKDFKKVLKDEGVAVNAFFRYYLPDEKAEKEDVYRSSINQYKTGIRCTFCDRLDENKDYVMRIPQQCCVGSKGDAMKTAKGKQSCCTGMHVGCARWAQPNKNNVQHVYWFPPKFDDACMYCSKHAEAVDKKIKKEEAAKRKPESSAQQKKEKKRSPTRDKKPSASSAPKQKASAPTPAQKKTKKVTGATATQQQGEKVASTPTPAQKKTKKVPDVSTTTQSTVPRKSSQRSDEMTPSIPKKRKTQVVDLGSVLSPNPTAKKKQKNAADSNESAKVWTSQPPPAASNAPHVRRGSHWQLQARKPKDRYAELDATQATAVNAGERPTLSKKRRELADQKSQVTDNKTQQILDDLLKHSKGVNDNELKAMLKARKSHFKRYFSEMTTEDLIGIWKEARAQFLALRKDKSKSPGANSPSQANTVDLSSEKGKDQDEAAKDTSNSAATEHDKEKENVSSREETPVEKTPAPTMNRWSKLFLGPDFQLGDEFTMDEFEELW